MRRSEEHTSELQSLTNLVCRLPLSTLFPYTTLFRSAFDGFGLALAQCAALCVERCIKLLSPQFSGLALHLTRHGPTHSGFATVQKTLTSLYNRIRHADAEIGRAHV